MNRCQPAAFWQLKKEDPVSRKTAAIFLTAVLHDINIAQKIGTFGTDSFFESYAHFCSNYSVLLLIFPEISADNPVGVPLVGSVSVYKP